MNFENLRGLIAEGEEEQVLDIILTNIHKIKNKKVRNEIIHTSSRLKKLLSDKRLGILENENSNISYNQITKSIIELIDRIEKSYTLRGTQKFRKKIKAYAPIIIAIVAIFLFFKRNYVSSFFNTVRIELVDSNLIENIHLEGGNIIYDIIVTNNGKSNLILNQLNISSSSNGSFGCYSGRPGGLEVTAEYEIDFHVNSKWRIN